MGLPIIGHLARKGFRTYRDRPRSEKEIGGGKAKAHMVGRMRRRWRRESDVVLVCVGFDHEVRELLEENREALKGRIVAILSTIHPKTVQGVGRKRTRAST